VVLISASQLRTDGRRLQCCVDICEAVYSKPDKIVGAGLSHSIAKIFRGRNGGGFQFVGHNQAAVFRVDHHG